MNIVALLFIVAAFVMAIIGVAINSTKYVGIAVIILTVGIALSQIGGKVFP